MDLKINNTYTKLLNESQPIIVAVSGGVDSLVLLNLLMKSNYKVVIAHVDHHKRLESETEKEYLINFAALHNIKIEVFDFFHSDENFQAEAHDKRYEFFYNVYKKYNGQAIATAHHAQDNLETILMNLIRGSNLYGYAGIKEISNYKDALMIRPLIHFSKDQIYEYAKENNIKFFEDSSNQQNDYLRNRIRHNIIPKLLEENPSLFKSVDNYSTQLFEAFGYFRQKAIDYINSNNSRIKLATFNKLQLIEQKNIINYLFDDNNIDSSDNKINDIIDIITNNRPNLSYDLGNNYRFIKAYDECYITKVIEQDEINEQLNLYDSIVLENYGNFFFRKTLLKTDKSFIKVAEDELFPFTIRHRKNGDRIEIKNGHKKVKDFLIDKKISKEDRDKVLVVTNALGDILWIVGYYRKVCNSEKFIYLIYEEKENEQ